MDVSTVHAFLLATIIRQTGIGPARLPVNGWLPIARPIIRAQFISRIAIGQLGSRSLPHRFLASSDI